MPAPLGPVSMGFLGFAFQEPGKFQAFTRRGFTWIYITRLPQNQVFLVPCDAGFAAKVLSPRSAEVHIG